MRVRRVMITAALTSWFAACASAVDGDDESAQPVYGTVCAARCACEGCSGDDEHLCEAEQEAAREAAEDEDCQEEHTAYMDCVRLEGRCVDGRHAAEVCDAQEAALADCIEPRRACTKEGDGICDEPGGTGHCPTGTDPGDCIPRCPSTGDGICDEPGGTGRCPEGTDADDCQITPCGSTGNGVCDEPEGTGDCEEGMDPADCAVVTCGSTDNGVCDEPEGTGRCPEGTDASDCSAEPCSYMNDGVCDEPEVGTGLCPEGTDVRDCSGPATCDDIGECGSSTSGCTACANAGSCSDELDACVNDNDCFYFTQCIVTCDNDACVDACWTANPSGAMLYSDYHRCVTCDECYISCRGVRTC